MEALFVILQDGVNPKYNWLGNIRSSFLLPIGEEGILEDLTVLLDEQKRLDLFHSYVGYRKSLDYDRCLNFTSLLRFPSICDLGRSYLYLKNALPAKAFVVQTKLLNKYNNRLIAQGKIYVLGKITCHFCNLGSQDIHLFLFDCPLFHFLRQSLGLPPDDSQLDSDHPLINLSETSLNSLIKFTISLCNNQLSEFIRVH